MKDYIAKYHLQDGRIIGIFHDENPRDPRDNYNETKLCIRKHREYDFPNELDFDFEADDIDDEGTTIQSQLMGLEKQYYIFTLDMYEHSGIDFSISGEGVQCKFDTARGVGFIAVQKIVEGGIENTIEQAVEIARNDLKQYSAYVNGEVYGYDTLEEVKRTNEKYGSKIEYEETDSCSGYYDTQSILDEFSLTDKDIM